MKKSQIGTVLRPPSLLRRVMSRKREAAGTPPGTLVHTGERKVEHVGLQLIEYDAEHFVERKLERIEECYESALSLPVTWVNVDGLHDVELIAKVGREFGVHPLALEDVVSTTQRAKVEAYENHFLVTLRMLDFDPATESVSSEQVTLIVGEHYIFSFQEHPGGDVFDPVRNRLRASLGRVRSLGPDYLAYSLIDTIIDHYFHILQAIGDRVEALEDEVMTGATTEAMHRLHHLRRESMVLRRAVWPLREAIGLLYRGEVPLVHEETRLFLRDAHDHCVQVIDTVETLRELLTSTMELYMTSVSNRLNEVMKVLTIISTIFIPLSFLAGVYGMNFEFMPELAFRWGYPVLLSVMAGGAIGMLFFFRRKGWF